MSELLSVEDTNSKYHIEMLEALERLEKNKDYIKVIEDGYFRDETLRTTSLLASYDIKSKGLRPELMENLIAISNLQNYLETVRNLGENARYNKANPLSKQDLVNTNMED